MNKKKTLEEKQEIINNLIKELDIKKYEVIVILKPRAKISKFLEKLSKFSVNNLNDIGIKELAYQLQNYKKGHYIIFDISSNGIKQAIFLNNFLKEQKNVLKFLTLEKEDRTTANFFQYYNSYYSNSWVSTPYSF